MNSGSSPRDNAVSVSPRSGPRAERRNATIATPTGSRPTFSELYQPTTPDQIVVIYIHGNRVPSELAAPEGQHVYRLLTAGVADATPIRFVIWSWPSAQVQGPLRDVRTKANRTDLAGYCLAWLLDASPGESAREPARLQFRSTDRHGSDAPGGWWRVVRTDAATAPGDLAKTRAS